MPIILILFFIFANAAAAGNTPTISVSPFSDNNQAAASQGYGKVIAAMFGTHLRNETNFIVFEQGSSQKADAMLTGQVSVVGNLIQIDAKLISVSTGDVAVAEYAQVASIAELRPAVSKLAKTIEDKYLRQWMGGLRVTVLPAEGEVYLNGQFMGKASLNAPLSLENLLEGKYELLVLAGGYQKYAQSVQVQARAAHNIQVSLQSLPGSIRIESEPQKAEVFMNDQKVGTTPFSLDTIAQGNYIIELRSENYKPFIQLVKINSGQLSELKAKMEVISGSLFVQSAPPNAKVFMGNYFMGNTPLLLENINPGTTKITLSLPGYSTYKEDAKILPGKKSEINATINRETGKLTIVSQQHALSVKIAGESQMTIEAPFHKQTLNAGEYKITVSKEKYYDTSYQVSIKPNEELRLETELKLKPGRISFIEAGKTPTDVFIDGHYKGKAGAGVAMKLEVPEGEHVITLKNWFNEKEWKIQVYADKTEEISLQEFTKNSSFSWWGAFGAALVAIPIFVAGQK